MRQNKTCRTSIRLLQLLVLTLLASGCAAPQASKALQQRIDELLKIQQQQALQLNNLQEQLSSLTLHPPGVQPATVKRPGDPTRQDQALAPLNPASQLSATAVETAQISEAAELYLEAFAAIATGQMTEAESGFEVFIQRFPEHEYAGNANYWLAESLFSQQQSDRAETVLLEIIDNPQQQHKAPAAMARLTNFYRESDALNNAAAMLQMLNARYPESPELKRLQRSTEPR